MPVPRFLLALLCCWLSLPALATEPLTLLAEDDWAPYASVRHGQAYGMAIDIVRAAYLAVGVAVTFRSMPYARCMKLVEVGREVGCFNSLKDSSTLQGFTFGKQPLFTATIAIYSHQPANGVTVAALAGKRVGLTNGYTYGDAVEKNAAIQKDVAPNDLLTMRKLLAGRVEVALVYTRVADWLQTQHPDLRGRVRQVGVLLQDGLYISFSKSHPDAARVLPLLERGLARIRANGTHARIEAEWQRRYPGSMETSGESARR